jgi:Methylase involved in ubiquinone/menaquinone biosynthesis
MDNGTSQKVIDFFNKAADLPDKWDHNRQYQNYMLRQIKKTHGVFLDLGCGTGEFCKILAPMCDKVIGIDVAPKMIAEANKRNLQNPIEYILTDADTYLSKNENTFDAIVSIAAFHHMDYQKTLEECKKALKPGGVLIIQDLYHENTLTFKSLSLIGMIVNPFFMLIHDGRLFVSEEERAVWASHSDDDVYNTMSEISAMARAVLKTFSLKRHLFWRYTLVYNKPELL